MSENPAIQIVSWNGKSLELKKDSIMKIVEKIDKNLPIAILNVTGEFRTGKSTLLNLFISILEKYEKCENIDAIHIEDLKLCNGFKGSEKSTKGIWMLDRVFVIPNPSKKTEKMALLLVDTEGLESNDSKNGIDQVLFGISNLMSSLLILNQKGLIGKSEIINLKLLAEFCNEKEKGNGCYCGIELLMRDFKYEEEELGEQLKEMSEFKESLLNSNDILIRDNLDFIMNYLNIDVFGLPQPGDEIEYEDFNNSMSKFSDEFKELLLYFIKKILSEKLNPTYENKEFLYCLCETLDSFLRKDIPQFSQMHRIYFEKNNKELINKIMNDLIKPLKEKIEKSSLTPKEIKKECERANKRIEDYKPKFLGNEEMIKEIMDYLYGEVNILIKECEKRECYEKETKLKEERKRIEAEEIREYERRRLEEERRREMERLEEIREYERRRLEAERRREMERLEEISKLNGIIREREERRTDTCLPEYICPFM